MEIAQVQKTILLITTNVGSLFGEKFDIRKYWLEQISDEVEKCRPSFLALHIQESGGKNYKQHSREMPLLVEELQRRLAGIGFIASRCFLDIQYENMEEYTALSSLFFIHESIVDHVWQYNFRQRAFAHLPSDPLTEGRKAIFTSGLVRSGFVRKEKFSRDFWPNFRFSRKGFLHTRWKIGDKIFDLINIHLFHDESNLNFLEHPLQYSSNRQNALNYVLHKFEKFNGGTLEGNSHLFIFGDFNFRLNLAALVKKLTMQTSEREILLCSSQKNVATRCVHSASDYSSGTASSLGEGETEEWSEDSAMAGGGLLPSPPPSINRALSVDPSASSSETDDIRTSCDDYDDELLSTDELASSLMRRKNSVIEYYKPLVREYLHPADGPDGNVSWVLRIGRKRFEYHEAGWLEREWRTYIEDDCEPREFPLHEIRPEFPPTYPWEEEANCHKHFMGTRAPAWCDRILFNGNARKQLMQHGGDNTTNRISTTPPTYRSFGMDNCIGDHKPVLLLLPLPS